MKDHNNQVIKRILLLLFLLITSIGSVFAEGIFKELKLSLEDLDEIAVNQNTGKLYTAARSTNSVLVIDTKTFKQTGSIMLGEVKGSSFIGIEGDSFPLSISLAINTTTNKVYTANLDAMTVSVINGNSNTLEDTISLDIEPFDIAVNPNTNKIYVAGTKNEGQEQAVIIIDGGTNSVLASIKIDDSATRIAVNSQTNKIYTGGYSKNILSVIDGATNTVTQKITVKNVSGDINEIAIDPVSNKIFAAFRDGETFSGNIISVIDGSTNQVLSELKLDRNGEPVGLAVDKDSSKLFAVSFRGIVTTFDTMTNKVLDTTYARFGLRNPVFDPSSHILYGGGSDNSKGVITAVKIESALPASFTVQNGTKLEELTSDIVEGSIGIFSTVVGAGSLPSNVRPFRSPVLSVLKSLNKALGSSKSDCGKQLVSSFNRLKSLMLSIKRANNKFYSEDSILGDDFDDIQRVVKTDDIADGIPDVCGN